MDAIDAVLEAARDGAFYRVPVALKSAAIDALIDKATALARTRLQGEIAQRQRLEKSAAWAAEKKQIASETRAMLQAHPVYAAVRLLRAEADGSG